MSQDHFTNSMKTTFHNTRALLAMALCSGLGIFSFACDPATKPDKGANAELAKEEAAIAAWPVSLNAGQKWQVDGHTRDSIVRMKKLLEDNEAATLGKSLAGEFHDLMKGCTMQGEAHNQLHVFLNELMPRILALPADGDDVEFKVEREKIQNLLQDFDRYFE